MPGKKPIWIGYGKGIHLNIYPGDVYQLKEVKRIQEGNPALHYKCSGQISYMSLGANFNFMQWRHMVSCAFLVFASVINIFIRIIEKKVDKHKE